MSIKQEKLLKALDEAKQEFGYDAVVATLTQWQQDNSVQIYSAVPPKEQSCPSGYEWDSVLQQCVPAIG